MLLSTKVFRFAAPTVAVILSVTAILNWTKFHHSQSSSQALADSRPDTDSPDEALKWRRLAWVDDNGVIAPGSMARAISQKRAMTANHKALVSGWQEVGPANLSGRSTCLAIDPNHPLTMWMGSAGGGVWKSTDGGTTWSPQGDTLKSLAVNALILDPNDHTTLYAGTGEGYFNIDAVGGFGVFKSLDGGTTWTQMPGTASWSNVNRIAIQPGNSNIMLASVKYGGIYRSTDAGTTWKQVVAAQSGHAIAFTDTNPQRVIGSIQDYNFTTKTWFESAIFSTDAGVTWTKASGPLNTFSGFGRIETAPVHGDQNSVYASASDGLIYKSVDGGASYLAVTLSGNTGTSWYGNAIWVDPTNSNRIVVGGTYIYGSTDGGVTMKIIGQGYIQTTQPHPDVHYIVQSPTYDGTTNRVVYTCTDGGLYEAVDISTASTNSGWLRRDQGARTTQYYSIAGDGPSGRIVGGLQDNGTQSNLLGSNQSQYIYGGDGGYVAIDSQSPQYVYGEYIYLELFRNNDGGSGNNAGSIYGGLNDAGSGSTANFIAPFILDPNNSQVLLAGGASLWRSPNARASSPTWAAIRAPSTSVISAITVAPGNSDVIWVGQNDGTVAMTTNGTSSTPTWKTISAAGSPLPSRYVTRILVDPSNSNIVYVTVGGFTTNNVWKTTNAGDTWTSITGTGSGTLPQVPVRAIVRDLYSANSLIVGTEIGVFSTTNGGQSWSVSSDLPANVSVDELAYMNNSTTLLAGTHGRGVWVLPGSNFGLASLATSPTSTAGGSSVTGTVTISPAAPSQGMTVNLISNSADAKVPTSVTVPGGATTVNFQITTLGVKATETVTIQATLANSQQTANLTLTPAALGPVTLSPTSIVGGKTVSGSVSLSGAAPPNGAIVYLSSNSTLATVPTSITVPAGSTVGNFTVNTFGVTSTKSVTISAVFGNSSQSATLSINPAGLQSVTLSSSSVVGGSRDFLTGTVNLSGIAGSQVTVALQSSSTTVATVPISVKVPAGASSVTFSVTHLKVTTSSSFTVKATSGGIFTTASCTVAPFVIASSGVNPTSLFGGTSSVGSVTLNAVPGTKSGAISVKLSSASKAVKLPATVSVPIGSSSASFTVGTYAVATNTTATILSVLGSSSQQALLAINAPKLSGLAVSPSSVKGSASTAVVGTVTLSGIAPTGGIAVSLTSSNTNAATVPSTVTVPAGQNHVAFKVTHKKIATQESVVLTASASSITSTASLTITPG